MLENKLYIIEHKEIDGENAKFTIRQNKGNEIFKAHFPGNPITPGACLIEISKELCEQTTERKLAVSSIKNVKFMNVINPIENEFVDFNINLSSEENVYNAKIQISEGSTIFSKIHMELHAQ